MLSQTNEYALRAAVSLAQNDGRSLTTDALAELTGVPRGYLAKVLQQLRRSGIVASQRGLHGGFTLARPVVELTVLDIVDAIDPLPQITTCPLGRREHGAELCPLHRTLQQVDHDVERALGATTLAALVPDPAAAPLCETPDHQGK
jgi:Rrf2 family protein